MTTIKLVNNIEVPDVVAELAEKDEILQDMLLVGTVIQSMKPDDALNILFSVFNTLCDKHNLSKGKILFEWSEQIDKFDEFFKKGI